MMRHPAPTVHGMRVATLRNSLLARIRALNHRTVATSCPTRTPSQVPEAIRAVAAGTVARTRAGWARW